jgi:hypothetical protein
MTRRVFDPELAVRTEPAVELVVGRDAVRQHVHAEFARLRRLGDAAQVPTVIGEFGLPFRPEDHGSGYAGPTAALDLYLGAMEAETIGGALWHWNREDFSLIGRDDPDGRALAAIFRPRLVALAGREAQSVWDRGAGLYTLTWSAQPGDRRATRIGLPAAWSADSAAVTVVGARRCPAPPAEICLLAEDARPRLSIQLPPAM